MTGNKTRPTVVDVETFIAGVKHDTRRSDAKTLVGMLKKITGKKPVMWGPSIIGFDQVHYKYDSGHEGDICMIGFSPRASSQVFYMAAGFPERPALLARLGKHRTGKGCLYINKLADVDLAVLEEMMTKAYAWSKSRKNEAPC